MAGVQQNITYKRELFAGDVVEIRSRLLELREKAVRFVHQMRDAELDEVVAICEITAVHLNRQTRKSHPFPVEIRRAAEERLSAD